MPLHLKNTRYPLNLTYSDFFMFLAHPTFTYQDHYPVSENKRSLKKIFWRAMLIVLGFVSF